jgi:thiol-disulfide isomerase/thioredoxin
MNENITKKIEVFTNIAIICVVLLIGFVAVKKYVFNYPDATAVSKPPAVEIGTKINLPGIDWAGNNQSLVVVISTDCHFCHESVPFYQELSRRAAQSGHVKMIAVFPQEVSTAKEYLDSNSITVGQIIQANPPNIGVRGTPTLLLIDKDGRVTETWLGRLVDDQERKVFERLSLTAAENSAAEKARVSLSYKTQ